MTDKCFMSLRGPLLWWLVLLPEFLVFASVQCGRLSALPRKPSTAISHLQLNGFNLVSLVHDLWCETAKIPTAFPFKPC